MTVDVFDCPLQMQLRARMIFFSDCDLTREVGNVFATFCEN